MRRRDARIFEGELTLLVFHVTGDKRVSSALFLSVTQFVVWVDVTESEVTPVSFWLSMSVTDGLSDGVPKRLGRVSRRGGVQFPTDRSGAVTVRRKT